MHENLLEKIEAGLPVSIDDVLRADAETKLAELQAEAERRQNVRQIEEGRQQTREHRLEQMLFLDRQAENARRKFENITKKREQLLQELTEAENKAISEWHFAHSQFVSSFAGFVPNIRRMASEIVPNQLEAESLIKQIKNELKAKGAKLQAVLYNYTNRGKSFLEIPNLPPVEDESNGNNEPPAGAKAA